MTQDTKRLLTIILVILILGIVVVAFAGLMRRETMGPGMNDINVTTSNRSGGNQQVPSQPANNTGTTTGLTDSTGTGLTLVSPTGGQRFVAGETVTISWHAPENLMNSRMTITLMQGDRVVSTLTGSQAVLASAGTFSWKVPNLGATASTDGYSLVLSTGNVRIESGEFRIFQS